MKAESWKKIIDDLDDDIVDSAAERLSKPEHSTVDDMEAFTHDGKPTEYKYPSERAPRAVYRNRLGGCRCGGGGIRAAEQFRAGDVSEPGSDR